MKRKVYVMDCGDFVKIGVSGNVEQRAWQMEVKTTIQIKKFFHWYFFEPRKTLLEWFMAKFPNFPLYVSIASLLLIILRPEVESCIRHIQQIGQRLILLLGL